MSTHLMTIIPFSVPHYVSLEMPARPKQIGFQVLPQLNLGELTSATLNTMCDEFRLAVLTRAEQQRQEKDA